MSKTNAQPNPLRKPGWGASVRSEGERSEPERRSDSPPPRGVPGPGGAVAVSSAAAPLPATITHSQQHPHGVSLSAGAYSRQRYGVPGSPSAAGAERSTEAPQPGGVPGPGGAVPQPEVLAKASRRRFTADYKRQILDQADACTEPGQLGALLRREGLYSSHLTTWHRQRERGTLEALAPKRRGPKPTANPWAEENRKLQGENQRLTRRLQQAELIIEIQKKASEILGIPLRSLDAEGSE